jgi:hypothetical protein
MKFHNNLPQYYPCYFCQSPIPSRDMDGHFHCIQCAQEHQLKAVITTLDHKDNFIIYAHLITKDSFHVRLHLRQGQTVIEKELESGNSIILPGFPINPNNIDKKLKLYLTFS